MRAQALFGAKVSAKSTRFGFQLYPVIQRVATPSSRRYAIDLAREKPRVKQPAECDHEYEKNSVGNGTGHETYATCQS